MTAVIRHAESFNGETLVTIRRGHKLMRFRFLRALRVVHRHCPAKHRTVIDFTIAETQNLLDHGEEGAGLELLVSNLDEVTFPVSAALHAELDWLAARLTIGPSYAALLVRLRESGTAVDQIGTRR